MEVERGHLVGHEVVDRETNLVVEEVFVEIRQTELQKTKSNSVSQIHAAKQTTFLSVSTKILEPQTLLRYKDIETMGKLRKLAHMFC